MSREYTKKLYSLIASEAISKDAIIDLMLSWMDEASVEEMCKESDLSEFFEDED
jgi:hypothetical protein